MSAPGVTFPEAPDLLRRFVATPFHVTFTFGGVNIAMETNCEQLAQAFEAAPENEVEGKPVLRLIAIVDSELRLDPAAAPLVLESGHIVWGRGEDSLFALDREGGELSVFLRQFEARSFEVFLHELLSRLRLPPLDMR